MEEELDAAGVLLDDEADEDDEDDEDEDEGAEEPDDASDDFDSLLAPEPLAADPEALGVDEVFDDRLSFR